MLIHTIISYLMAAVLRTTKAARISFYPQNRIDHII